MIQSKFSIIILFFLIGFPTLLSSQISTNERPVSESVILGTFAKAKIPTEVMPSINLAKLQIEDEQDEINGLPPRFGKDFAVNYNLNNSGLWETLPNGDRLWRLAIQAPGAKSINFLYNDFWLPVGAKLFIYNKNKSHIIGAFTSINNKVDRKMGTGLVYGDEVIIEYYEPQSVKASGALEIGKVVHGYRHINIPDDVKKAFGDSGSCNVNTVCSQGDNWRDEIKGVALILVNGNRNCTGSLITNVEKDCIPYFLTANHCLGNLDAGANASTWTFMWRYESPDCGHNVSDGPTNMTTAGATIVSNSGNPGQIFESDFALLRLTESPVDANYDIYFNGFDASTTAATGSTGIHHPSGDLKKISMYGATLFSANSNIGGTPPGAGTTHWRIDDWDSGTTEPGSSGSPLFSNATKRIIGDLSGGTASCSSATYDAYGQVAYSWDANATTTRQLKNWLDPNNTGTNFADGHYPSICTFATITTPDPQSVCQGTNAVYSVSVTDHFTSAVTLSITGIPTGANVNFSINPVAPGGTTNLTISNTNAVTPGAYTIQIAATDGTNSSTENIVLNIVSATTTPTLISPTNGATNVTTSTNFSWSTVANATTYEVEGSTDAAFGTVVFSGTVSGTTASVSNLISNTQYFWRVRATNICGNSPWSTVFDFTTANCTDEISEGGFENGPNSAWTESSSTNLVIVNNTSSIYNSGSWSAWLRGNNNNAEISQSVTISPNATSATLSYFYGIISNEGAGDCTFDIGYLDLNGTTVTTFPLCADTNTPGFVRTTVDLAAYIGMTVEIKFRFTADNFASSNMFIDDITVEVCEPTTVLPVEWLNISAKPKDGNIQLQWSVANEVNNAGFEVLRSSNIDTGFEKIAWIDSQEQQTYSFLDTEVRANVSYYYKIRQVDFDNKSNSSRIVEAIIKIDDTVIDIYPNPTQGQVFINYISEVNQTLNVQVFDALGQVVLTQEVLRNSPATMLDWSRLSRGIYFVRMDNGAQVKTERIVVQ